jgi:hypothetical protein
MNDQELKATLVRVVALPLCDCLICTLRTIPLDPRGIQPIPAKKPRAKRGQSLKKYVANETSGVLRPEMEQ